MTEVVLPDLPFPLLLLLFLPTPNALNLPHIPFIPALQHLNIPLTRLNLPSQVTVLPTDLLADALVPESLFPVETNLAAQEGCVGVLYEVFLLLLG